MRPAASQLFERPTRPLTYDTTGRRICVNKLYSICVIRTWRSCSTNTGNTVWRRLSSFSQFGQAACMSHVTHPRELLAYWHCTFFPFFIWHTPTSHPVGRDPRNQRSRLLQRSLGLGRSDDTRNLASSLSSYSYSNTVCSADGNDNNCVTLGFGPKLCNTLLGYLLELYSQLTVCSVVCRLYAAVAMQAQQTVTNQRQTVKVRQSQRKPKAKPQAKAKRPIA